jgi:hypothetical protein
VISIFQARFLALNDNLQRLLDAIAARGDADVAVVDVSTADPASVSDRIARSTVIAIDQSLVNAATWERPNGTATYHIANLRARDYYRDVVERLLEAPAPRAFLANSDLHDSRDDVWRRWLGGRVEALFWMFERPPYPPSEVRPEYSDPWFTKYGDMREAWCRTVAAFPVRVDTWFAIDDAELDRATAARGRWDVCVPGAPYATRRLAAGAARAAGLSVAPFQEAHKLLRGVARATHPVLPPYWSTRLNVGLQQAFQRSLVRAGRAVFVCGSGVGFPVLKFLEVPAARRPMLAYPCAGFEDYGFRDGEHAVVTTPEDGEHAVVTTPEDFGRDARRVLQDDRLRERIVDRAWRLARDRHSASRRAADVVECLRRHGEGRLHSAGFVSGRFEIT